MINMIFFSGLSLTAIIYNNKKKSPYLCTVKWKENPYFHYLIWSLVKDFYPHFIDVETEAQKDWTICPRWQNHKAVSGSQEQVFQIQIHLRNIKIT